MTIWIYFQDLLLIKQMEVIWQVNNKVTKNQQELKHGPVAAYF